MTKTDYDYIIIGTGIAGLNTALLAREHGSVLVLTKGKIDDCNTRYAQGGIAAAIGQGDSPLLHMQDTLSAGAGLCDPEAVQILTQEGPQRVADLIHWGVPFDTIHGQINLGREGAHSLPRILHAGGDATGQHIELTLAGLVRESAITLLEYSIATRLIVEEGMMKGVEVLDSATGQTQTFSGRFIILATGEGLESQRAIASLILLFLIDSKISCFSFGASVLMEDKNQIFSMTIAKAMTEHKIMGAIMGPPAFINSHAFISQIPINPPLCL